MQQVLVESEGGEPDAFWRLAYLLQCEPETARGQPRQDDNLLDFPGIAVLPADHPDRLTNAALRYLSVQDDRAAEWVGQGILNYRAWAGYLAMAMLYRQGRLGELPPERWACWTHALIDSITTQPEGDDVKRKLLAIAAQHAPQRLADSVKEYVRAELARGSSPFDVRYIDPGWAPPLAAAWADMVTEVAAAITRVERVRVSLVSDKHRAIAMETWETMVAALLTAGDARGVELAVDRLRAGSDDPGGLALAGRAGRALLRADCAGRLATVLAATSAHPATGREIALATGAAYDGRTLLEALSVEQLVGVYRWLSEVLPPDQDPPIVLEGRFVGPEEQARRWRDSVPEALVTLGTSEAVEALAGLREAFRDRQFLLYCLVRARWVAAAERWRAPEPAEVARLLDDATRRFARSDAELIELLLEILGQIGADLPKHGDLLWNHQADGSWRPEYEYALQAYLAHELELRLVGRGVIVNREVMVQPTDALTGAGDRTDILVEVTPRTNTADGRTAARAAVVIEIKGSWNPEVPTAQRTQLADRYIPAARSSAGIYLVGWYPLDSWTKNDCRRTAAARYSKERLLAELSSQAEEIAADGVVSTVPCLLDVNLPVRKQPEPG
ncbi:hypothetical protein [Dactylosporangium sp. CA-092794]|uniref:hypothetical protein n=1 Tax=Dactylosporangium sp. CA-092794 TaxID=3239929 RepID=UPI003D913D68